MGNLSILHYDLETAPLLGHFWQLKQDYINPDGVVNDTFMLSWAAKWDGAKSVKSMVLTEHEARKQEDNRIVEGIADLVRDADMVVAHNADRFDVPVLRGRVMLLDQPPLGPVRSIDTLKVARKSFRLTSNRLGYIAQVLGVPSKADIDFEVWKAAYQGDPKALKRMEKYNRQDVRVLEAVFHKLKPHIKGLPRLVEPSGENVYECPFCGSSELQRRGYHRTNAYTYQRVWCKDCGRWSRYRTREKGKKGLFVPTPY